MPIRPSTQHLDEDGRAPAVKLEVTPLDSGREPYTLDKFQSYTFNSNILVPVDTFCFTFKPPEKTPIDDLIQEGDGVQLTVSGIPLATGYVDSVEVTTDSENSTTVTVNGRDLIGVLEDNDAVNPDSTIIWTNAVTLDEVIKKLIANTRLEAKGFEVRNIPQAVKSLFATNPGESKLAALQRFLDPLNAIVWTSGTGKLIIGRPSFSNGSLGVLGMRILGGPAKRGSNVLSMSVRKAAGQIPNGVLVVWTGNEALQSVNVRSVKVNQARGPNRLYKANHRIYRCLAVSAPDANDTKSGLTEVQRIISQGANYMDSLAARELARENVAELIVTCTVQGHLDPKLKPIRADTCYDVLHDLAGVDKKMYLFGAEYALAEDGGQHTTLSFCNLNTIVAGSNVVADNAIGTGSTNLA